MKKISELTGKDVIHCSTKKEAKVILKLAHEAGYKWNGGTSYLVETNWNVNRENTCYKITEGMYSNLEYIIKGNYVIHKASEFLESVGRFEIGDKVVSNDMQLTELPKAWFVKTDGSQLFKDTVIKYLNETYGVGFDGAANTAAYGVNVKGKPIYQFTTEYFGEGAIELTLEQFIKLTTKEMTKEIVGYKCPTDLFGGTIKKDTVFIQDVYQNKNVYYPNTYNSYGVSPYIHQLPKEMVETWEPMYAQDNYKVGDWVIGWKYRGNPVIKLLEKKGSEFVTSYKGIKGDLCNLSICDSSIQRKATTQQIKSHLIALAKEKGFVDGLKLKNVIAPNGTTGFNGSIRISWEWQYRFEIDTLSYCGVTIYENGAWATIKPKEEVVSVGGKFNVTIKDGKIWHKNDDITSFVKHLISWFSHNKQFGGYQAVVKDVEFSKVGCQQGTKLSDWLHVLDMYNKLNKF